MAFKMKAGSEGPMKKNYPAAFKKQDGLKKEGKLAKTDAQDKKELERQTIIQENFQKSAERSRKRKQMELRELGYFMDDDGKIVHPKQTHKTLKKKEK